VAASGLDVLFETISMPKSTVDAFVDVKALTTYLRAIIEFPGKPVAESIMINGDGLCLVDKMTMKTVMFTCKGVETRAQAHAAGGYS